METLAEIAARVARERVAAERREIETLIYDLREYTATGYVCWDFDLSMDEAVARVRRYIEEFH